MLQNVPQAGGYHGRVCINRAVLFQSVFGQETTSGGFVLFSGHIVLLVEVCVPGVKPSLLRMISNSVFCCSVL